ncbi:MAG TPA: phosphoribosylformylglycinamidine cyclo-ligase [Chloroflexota bacterium]|nr:phosphoribosylformylglycinamidine cyclo-ligase [Chloroflexota bacterium]
MPSNASSYRAAGVDIEAGNDAKARIGPLVRSTFGARVLTDVGPLGAFGGVFALGGLGLDDPVLVASADGVGTKLKIAFLLDRHDTIGVDLVNHCVDDVLTAGARPLFFLDYFATATLRPAILERVVAGLAAACRAANCALLGGETAQMPGFYQEGEYDLAGFLVGIAERGRLLGPGRVRAGDVLIGLPSSGLHTNGYALVRRVLARDGASRLSRARLEQHEPALGRPLGDELLEPHRSYLNELGPHLDRVKAIAHITGGGLIDNLPRALPAGAAARLDAASWREPPIFRYLQALGELDEAEMDRTFNRGLGMVVVAAPEQADALVRAIPGASVVGDVVPREEAAPAVTVIR